MHFTAEWKATWCCTWFWTFYIFSKLPMFICGKIWTWNKAGTIISKLQSSISSSHRFTPEFPHVFDIKHPDAVAFASFNNMVEIFESHPLHTTSCKRNSLPFNKPHVFRHQGILWFSSQQTPLVQWLARRWNSRSTRSLHLPQFVPWDGRTGSAWHDAPMLLQRCQLRFTMDYLQPNTSKI